MTTTTTSATTAPQRRPLDFQSFDAVAADVDALASARYSRCGTWDLAHCCDHLAKTIDRTLDNHPVPIPLFFRMLSPVMGPLVLKRILKKRAMSAGFKAPAPFAPDQNCSTDQAVARLKAALERAEAVAGEMPRHPFFGRMTAQQWQDLMLVHCAHHLSFLVPVG
jgi:hypothetical protein